MDYTPQKENITFNDETKTIYQYCDINGRPVFKSIEIEKTRDLIKIYPYNVNRKTDEIKVPKIKIVELFGWENLTLLPIHFRKSYGSYEHFGLQSIAIKRLIKTIIYKFKSIEKLKIVKEGSSRFYVKSLTLSWSDIEPILKKINTEKTSNERYVKQYINNELSKLSSNFTFQPRNLNYGDLERFMERYDSFDKVTDADINSISRLIELLPKSKITVTSNFIKTKNNINIVFFEEILTKFKILRSSINDNEKEWQSFFEKYSWIFSHLFPYDVILNKKEAYVGGTTVENKDGKIVDFLYQNGFKDNYALIEIKTHKKDLLKNTAYRGTDVFAYSDDLSGGISQCLDQKDNFIKDFGKDLKPIDPKCILVIGLRSKLKAEQVKCFELLRNNQKNVDIVTFDELEKKIEGLLKVLSSK